MRKFFILSILLISSSLSAQECIQSSSKNIFNILEQNIGAEICITGKITLQPHSVYFDLIENNENLYTGRIYLPIRYADALRKKLKSGDTYTSSGVLEITRSPPKCDDVSCSIYYLTNK